MTFPWEVGVLAAVLLLNRLVVPSSYTRPVLFWAVQGVNLVLAVLVLIFGLPGLGSLRVVSWLVAGLLVFHVVQNYALRDQALTTARRDAAERERIKKLRSLEPPVREPEAPEE